jgi:hypothetical protein
MGAGMWIGGAHGLQRLSPLCGLLWIPLAPVVFPPALLFYLGIYAADGLWVKGVCLIFLVVLWWSLDRYARGPLNSNIARIDSALAARAAAANGREPAALLLRAFREELGYVDLGGSFSLYELIEPALRETGFRPLALGANLPLPPSHGVAFVATADDSWWEVFTTIADDAAVIVVVPQDTPSLGRELHWLGQRGLLAKIAVVMAPESLQILHYTGADGVTTTGPAADNEGRVAAWGTARQVWSAALGVDLPAYDARGALIVFTDDGTASIHPLRTRPEKPKWFAAQLVRDYERRYGVDFARLWTAVTAERCWRGAPVADIWRRISPGPISIDARAYIRPPGATGLEWHELGMMAAAGWGATLGALLIAVGAFVWKLI